MEQAHVDTQFAGLVERTWLPIEAQALEATAYETFTPPGHEATEPIDYDTAAIAFHCRERALARLESGEQGRHRKPRKRLWLPVLAYLRGDLR